VLGAFDDGESEEAPVDSGSELGVDGREEVSGAEVGPGCELDDRVEDLGSDIRLFFDPALGVSVAPSLGVDAGVSGISDLVLGVRSPVISWPTEVPLSPSVRVEPFSSSIPVTAPRPRTKTRTDVAASTPTRHLGRGAGAAVGDAGAIESCAGSEATSREYRAAGTQA